MRGRSQGGHVSPQVSADTTLASKCSSQGDLEMQALHSVSNSTTRDMSFSMMFGCDRVGIIKNIAILQDHHKFSGPLARENRLLGGFFFFFKLCLCPLGTPNQWLPQHLAWDV